MNSEIRNSNAAIKDTLLNSRVSDDSAFKDTLPHGRGSDHSAFSLVELVIVIVIIGIIAAIAVPRFSKATEGAQAKAVAESLKIVNDAMQLYKADHGQYPGKTGTVDPDAASFKDQLLQTTNSVGQILPNTAYGPYLREIPKNPFKTDTFPSTDSRQASVCNDGHCAPCTKDGADTYGWFANQMTGTFNINVWGSDLTNLVNLAAPAPISYDHPQLVVNTCTP